MIIFFQVSSISFLAPSNSSALDVYPRGSAVDVWCMCNQSSRQLISDTSTCRDYRIEPSRAAPRSRCRRIFNAAAVVGLDGSRDAAEHLRRRTAVIWRLLKVRSSAMTPFHWPHYNNAIWPTICNIHYVRKKGATLFLPVTLRKTDYQNSFTITLCSKFAVKE